MTGNERLFGPELMAKERVTSLKIRGWRYNKMQEGGEKAGAPRLSLLRIAPALTTHPGFKYNNHFTIL
jgi:hypothetical protein